MAALQAGQPPDFAFSFRTGDYISQWAFDDRLVDLTDAVGHFSDLFDPDALAWWVRLNQKTGQRALYALPVGRTTNHLHVWKSLLEQAGFTLEDIPREWKAFWSFWCDQVQPAVRRATGREDIWGVGLPMSVNAADPSYNFLQLMSAYDADYVTRDGRLVIDDPGVRRRQIEALDGYTAVYRKGCTPPDSVAWDSFGNNEAFLAQRVVMTPNNSLSIPNALKRERPEDYYKNTATIEWPLGPGGNAFPIEGRFYRRRGVQGRPQRRDRQGVRAFSRGRGLARALSRLLRRAHDAGDAEAARCAVLARPERPAPHGRGDAGHFPAHAPRLRHGLGRLARRLGLEGERLGQGDPPRRRRGHQPRAGGRRGDRPHQADPERSEPCDRSQDAFVAAALVMAPLGARAADLVVWWY